MIIFDIIDGLLDFSLSWRLYLCAAVSIGFAIFLHYSFGDHIWVWFISIPSAIFGIIFGFYWQIKADRR
jgi:hypothetical protein